MRWGEVRCHLGRVYCRRMQVRKSVSNTERHLRRLAKLGLSSTSFLLKAHTHNRFPGQRAAGWPDSDKWRASA